MIIKQGETYRKRFEFFDPDTHQPIDLTGVSAYSQMRDKPGGVLKATATCNVDAINATITVEYSSAQTEAIAEGQYGFDVWITDNGDAVPIYTAEVQIVKRYTDNIGA